MDDCPRILIAGIGGASLGTEILKSLLRAGDYTLLGCDISALAYGHYQAGISKTFVVDRDRYAESVLQICAKEAIRAVIPGGEEPAVLLGQAAARFQEAGVHVAGNSPRVVALCSDKGRLFEHMKDLGLPVPWTLAVQDVREFERLENVPYPCVVKPSTGSGGSRYVFLASNQSEAALYLSYLLNNDQSALIQEYLPVEGGEFTVGVLSMPDGRLAGSVAMRRLFHTRLSISVQSKVGLISSGYSQGLIDEFSEVRAQSEEIARKLGSTGPLNIQARLRDGKLVPFEINPRFSASTYLRAMAGFNEINLYLRYVLFNEEPHAGTIKPGFYLRSLAEIYVDKEGLVQ